MNWRSLSVSSCAAHRLHCRKPHHFDVDCLLTSMDPFSLGIMKKELFFGLGFVSWLQEVPACATGRFRWDTTPSGCSIPGTRMTSTCCRLGHGNMGRHEASLRRKLEEQQPAAELEAGAGHRAAGLPLHGAAVPRPLEQTSRADWWCKNVKPAFASTLYYIACTVCGWTELVRNDSSLS